MRAIFANSLVPLKLIPIAGMGLVLCSALALIALMIYWLVSGVPFPGFGTIVALSVLSFGILTTLLSVMGIYIGLIYEEVRGRPNFVIRQVLTLPSSANERSSSLSTQSSHPEVDEALKLSGANHATMSGTMHQANPKRGLTTDYGSGCRACADLGSLVRCPATWLKSMPSTVFVGSVSPIRLQHFGRSPSPGSG